MHFGHHSVHLLDGDTHGRSDFCPHALDFDALFFLIGSLGRTGQRRGQIRRQVHPVPSDPPVVGSFFQPGTLLGRPSEAVTGNGCGGSALLLSKSSSSLVSSSSSEEMVSSSRFSVLFAAVSTRFMSSKTPTHCIILGSVR
eukprot:m.836225 g.836225  ORF g.836225 m.836225 type:complete len:141 (+) comp23458_c0_seq3:1424-1846(+)